MIEPPLVLLAAGKSSRLGYPKGLVQKDGEFWLLRQMNCFAKAGGTCVIIVLGFDSEKYISEMPLLEKALRSSVPWNGLKVKAVINPEPSRGQFSSLQTGILATEPLGDTFILPIDVPGPRSETWTELWETHRNNSSTLVTIPLWNEKGGHPIVLSPEFLKQVLKRNPDSSRLDEMIQDLEPEAVLRVPTTDKSISLNLNSAEDWNNLT